MKKLIYAVLMYVVMMANSSLANDEVEFGKPLFIKISISDIYHPLLKDADKQLVIEDFLKHLLIVGTYYPPKNIDDVTQKTTRYFETNIQRGIGFDKYITQVTIPNQTATIINRTGKEITLSIPGTVNQYWAANYLILEINNKNLLETKLKEDELDDLCLMESLPTVSLRQENLALSSIDMEFRLGDCSHTSILIKAAVSIADSVEQLAPSMPEYKITDEQKESALRNFVNRFIDYKYRPFEVVSDIPLLKPLFNFDYDQLSLEPVTLNERSKTKILLGRYQKKGEFVGVQVKGYLQDYFGVSDETQAKRQIYEVYRIENMMPAEWIEIHTLFFKDKLIDFRAFSSTLCGVQSTRQVSNLSKYQLKTTLSKSKLAEQPQEHCQKIRDMIYKLNDMPAVQLEKQMLLLKHDIEVSTIKEEVIIGIN